MLQLSHQAWPGIYQSVWKHRWFYFIKPYPDKALNKGHHMHNQMPKKNFTEDLVWESDYYETDCCG